MPNNFIKCPGCGKDWASKSGKFPAHAKTFQCPDCYYPIPIPDCLKSNENNTPKSESEKRINWFREQLGRKT